MIRFVISCFMFFFIFHFSALAEDCGIGDLPKAKDGEKAEDALKVMNCLLSRIRELEERKYLKSGMIILMPDSCPVDISQDITSSIDGHYIIADNSVVGVLKNFDGDGSHKHDGGAHSHHIVGETEKLGDGQQYGAREPIAPHQDAKLQVSGTALENESGHNSAHVHEVGTHEHKRVGVRLCRVK